MGKPSMRLLAYFLHRVCKIPLHRTFVYRQDLKKLLSPGKSTGRQQESLGDDDPFTDPGPTGAFVLVKSEFPDLFGALASEPRHSFSEFRCALVAFVAHGRRSPLAG